MKREIAKELSAGLMVALTLLILITFSGCTDESADLNLTDSQITAHFKERLDTITGYRATMEIAGEDNRTFEVVRYTAKYPDRYRVDYLSGEMKRENSFAVLKGTKLSEYFVYTDKATTAEVSPTANYLAYMDNVRHAQMAADEGNVLSVESGQIAGEGCYIIKYSSGRIPIAGSLSEGRYLEMTVWVDRETWLISELEIYDGDRLIRRAKYLDMEINADIPDSTFEFTPPVVVEVRTPPVHHLPQIFTSLHDAQKSLAPDIVLALPFYLPDGYTFGSGWSSYDRKGTRTIDYRRGNDLLYLEQGSPGDTLSSHISGTEQEVTVNGEKALFVASEDKNQLRWSGLNLSFALTGTIAREEMVKIAESVAPASYDPDIIPPYEYTPAVDPLERSFFVNQTTEANGVTVTFEAVNFTKKMTEVTVSVRLPPDPHATPTIEFPPGVTPPPPNPSPQAEFRVDSGIPLRITGGYSYRPEGDETLIFWKLEPVPSGAKRFYLNITRFGEQEGPWEFVAEVGDNCN